MICLRETGQTVSARSVFGRFVFVTLCENALTVAAEVGLQAEREGTGGSGGALCGWRG